MNPTTWRFNREAYFTGAWKQTILHGTHVYKWPTDLWVLAELVAETKPEVVIETGTALGGSALFLWKQGVEVVTVDVADHSLNLPKGITFVHGDSVAMAGRVGEIVGGRRAMVTLDSNHHAEHVLQEIHCYAPMVARGCYLVVEDTGVDAYQLSDDPREDYPTGGPGVAVEQAREFLHGLGFTPDEYRERYRLTMNPGGYWRRAA